MRSILIGSLLTALVLPALAQSPAPTTPQVPGTLSTTVNQGNMWRTSKVIGRNVYNEQNEKLGDIEEVLIDPNGKVEGFVIGVGGFLGMGEHAIMVEPSKLKFIDEPVRSSTTTNTTTTGEATRPATTTTSSTSSARNWYPDHAVLSGVSKDQLKAMPQFKYN
jgi:hypothetical protein